MGMGEIFVAALRRLVFIEMFLEGVFPLPTTPGADSKLSVLRFDFTTYIDATE